MHSSAKVDNIINVRITHKTARVPLMEAVAFKDKKQALTEIRQLEKVEECAILQTCNRIELFIVTENSQETLNLAKDYFAKRNPSVADEASKAIETSANHGAINHLLRITSGLESMVIGEDQVINQVWDAFFF
jgi:glutamyl-tRNA reductase